MNEIVIIKLMRVSKWKIKIWKNKKQDSFTTPIGEETVEILKYMKFFDVDDFYSDDALNAIFVMKVLCHKPGLSTNSFV